LFDQCRAAFRPKNVAGEYGQLRKDFKTSDPSVRYRKIGFDMRQVLSEGRGMTRPVVPGPR
jgi:hypothetical protein